MTNRVRPISLLGLLHILTDQEACLRQQRFCLVFRRCLFRTDWQSRLRFFMNFLSSSTHISVWCLELDHDRILLCPANAWVLRHSWPRLRQWLHWSQKRHNTAVWTDSRQGSRSLQHYCLCQWLHWNQSDWYVVSKQLQNVWPNKVGLFRAGIRPDSCCNFNRIWVSLQGGKTYLIDLVRDMPLLWDQRDKNYHKRNLEPKALRWNRREINPVSTKLYLSELKTQFVLRSKHCLLWF